MYPIHQDPEKSDAITKVKSWIQGGGGGGGGVANPEDRAKFLCLKGKGRTISHSQARNTTPMIIM